MAGSLLSALSRGRLANVYLFAGPEGAGKRRVALELAKASLCQGPIGADACGTCPSCLAIEEERHPDVSFFQPEKGKASYPVRQVREEIRKHAYLKPAWGSRRFLIIERAEALVKGGGGQNEGADTLLKLLEEPPETTVIILLAAHPERLPETIHSRCHRVRFDPPDAKELASVLAEEAGLEPGKALFVAYLAGGDLPVARSFLGGRKKDKPDLDAIRKVLLTVVESLERLSYPELLALAGELDVAAPGWPALSGSIGVLASLYRDAALRAVTRAAVGVGDGAGATEGGGAGREGATGDPEGLVLTFPTGPEASATRKLAAAHSPDRLRAMALRALKAQEDCRRYPARLLLLEVLFIDLKELSGC